MSATIHHLPRNRQLPLSPYVATDLASLMLFVRDVLPTLRPGARNTLPPSPGYEVDVYLRAEDSDFTVSVRGDFGDAPLQIACASPLLGLLHIAAQLIDGEIPDKVLPPETDPAPIVPLRRDGPFFLPEGLEANAISLMRYLHRQLAERLSHLHNLSLDLYLLPGDDRFSLHVQGGFAGSPLVLHGSTPAAVLLAAGQAVSALPPSEGPHPALGVDPLDAEARDGPST